VIVIGLEGGSAPWDSGEKVSAKLVYIDKPAGLSKDRREPETSFQAIAQLALQRAKKPTAAAVFAATRRLRMLHSAICAEGGAPWIDFSGDHGLACAPSRALEDAAVAEVKAALALGDPILAVAARERLSSSAASRHREDAIRDRPSHPSDACRLGIVA